jgi:ankyrin repeat protein
VVKNNQGNTPLHLAARHGTLDQVPRQFLTKETLTIRATPSYAPEGFYLTSSGYKVQTETVLHIAALYGHGDQLPQEFLTPEYLCLEARDDGATLLHYLARSKSLDLISKDYSRSEIWNMTGRNGLTPHDVLEGVIEQEKYVAQVRNGPATDKQKEMLRWFGYAFDEKITRGAASDAIEKCGRDNPEKDKAYYNHSPTEEQLEKIRQINEEAERLDGKSYHDLKTLTYGKAKDIIQEKRWAQK